MPTFKRSDLLAMYRVIEQAKDAVEKFERGEMNLAEAIGTIRDAITLLAAA